LDGVSHHARIRAPKTGEWREFDRVLLNAVEGCLRQVLGETAAEMTFSHLERKSGLRREEIPRNIEEFSSALTELLGSGTNPLEKLVIELLYSKLEVEYDAKPELGFTDHVEKLRKRFEDARVALKRFT